MILVDFNPLIIGAVHIAQTNLDPGTEVNVDFVRHLFLNQILHFRKKFHDYGDIVICCDSRNSWRKEVFPYYKAARKKERSDSVLDWNSIYESIDTIKQELDETFRYRVVYADRAEADDVIAVLAKYLQENHLDDNILCPGPQRIMIVSADKDFRQLQVFRNVEQYSPILDRKIVENRPDLYLKEHIIRGDSSDGVPNIRSDDDTFVVQGKRSKPIYQEKLTAWLECDDASFCDSEEMTRNYHRNRILVDLLHEIPPDIQTAIIERFESAPCENNNIFNYFMKHRLKNLMQDIHNF